MQLKNLYRYFVILLVLLFAQNSFAIAFLGLDYGTLRLKKDGASVSNLDRSTLDGYVGVGINQTSSLLFYLGYLQSNHVESFSDGTYESSVSAHPYVGFGYSFRRMVLPYGLTASMAYSPVSKLTLTQKTGIETWNGSALMAKVGFNVNLSRKFKITASVAYVNEQYAEKVSGSLTGLSSYTQNYLAPAVGIAAEF